MPQVPAGCLTGLYHIVVAGLPWQCSWQRLKDFARHQQPDGSCIEIDHAIVYPDSTDGWVRVRGLENFKKALAHLDGGTLENRSIMADGRNESDTVHLRDDICMSWSTSPSMPRRPRNSSSARDQVVYQQMSTPIMSYVPNEVVPVTSAHWCYQSPQASPTDFTQCYCNPVYYAQQSPVYEQPNPILQPLDYSMAPGAGMVYAGSIAPSTPVYIPAPQPMLTYMVSLPYADPLLGTHQTAPAQAQAQAPTVIKTEARKLIITSLPHNANETTLRTLLLKLLGSTYPNTDPVAALHEVEVARHSDHKSRGHAFVVFESHRVAKGMVGALDGLRWQGRCLAARFAKEGARPFERFGGAGNGERRWLAAVDGSGNGSGSGNRSKPSLSRNMKTSSSSRDPRAGSSVTPSTAPPSSHSENTSSCSSSSGRVDIPIPVADGHSSSAAGEVEACIKPNDPGRRRARSLNTPLVVSSCGMEHCN